MNTSSASASSRICPIERDPGERARDLGERELANALGRIVARHSLAAYFAQHDEVIEVPVQHAGQAQLREVIEIELERAGAEFEALGDLDHAPETVALERERKAAAQRGEVDMMAVEAGDYREAGEVAFGRFGLQDHRQRVADAERKPIQKRYGRARVRVCR